MGACHLSNDDRSTGHNIAMRTWIEHEMENQRRQKKSQSYMKYRFVADKNRSFSGNAATTAVTA